MAVYQAGDSKPSLNQCISHTSVAGPSGNVGNVNPAGYVGHHDKCFDPARLRCYSVDSQGLGSDSRSKGLLVASRYTSLP